VHHLPVSPHRAALASHAAPRISPAKTAVYVERDELEEQARKMRKIDEKFKENDLRALFLKTRITEDPALQLPVTNPLITPSENVNVQPAFTSTRINQPTDLASTKIPTPADTVDDDGHLSLMHQKLAESFMGTSASSYYSRTLSAPAKPAVWVAKWVDYSNKYGLGYLLSNGVCGAYFNDSTKMMSADQRQCEYVLQSRGIPSDDRKVYEMNPAVAHAHEINKKITLLKYFKHFLSQDAKAAEISNTSSALNLIYVKKWLRTKRAIVFRLSNKTVQVNFLEDHTKVILSPGAQDVTYVDKNQIFSTHFLATVLQEGSGAVTGRDHEELVERLKYTRDILFHMINHKKTSSKK
jgi:hypothetical protein